MQKISKFASVRDTVPSDTISFSQLIDEIRCGTWQQVCDEIRRAPYKDTRSELKRNASERCKAYEDGIADWLFNPS